MSTTALPTKPPQPPDRLPAPVALLGYGGLLPFIGLLVLTHLDAPRQLLWSQALVGYGAVILSFVGALHWGFAMAAPGLDAVQRRQAFVWSIVPALIAWPATVLPPKLAPFILVLGFVLHLRQDLRIARPAGLPAWYLPLRWQLSLVAGCCLLALAGWAWRAW